MLPVAFAQFKPALVDGLVNGGGIQAIRPVFLGAEHCCGQED
jgi:hypothetical protein